MKKPIQAATVNARRQAIIILGMHRSGTSALGGVLNLLGVSAPKTLQEGNVSNPKGYWESVPLVAANDGLLELADSYWDDVRPLDLTKADPQLLAQQRERIEKIISEEFGNSPLFFIKDPRICRFFSFLMDILNGMDIRTVVLQAVRNPLEVANSLHHRDGFSLSKGLLLWLRNTLDSEYYSRSLPRYFIPYEKLLTDWQNYLGLAARETGIRWSVDPVESESKIGDFLAETLRHERFTVQEMESHPDLVSWASESYKIILQMAAKGESEALLDRLHVLRSQFDEASKIFGKAIAAEEETTARLRGEIERQSSELTSLQTRASQLEEAGEREREKSDSLENRLEITKQDLSKLDQQLIYIQSERDNTIHQLDATRRRLLENFSSGLVRSYITSKEGIKLRAFWRYPFKSQRRKQFRESEVAALLSESGISPEAAAAQNKNYARIRSAGTLNIRAIVRHPLSSKNRKKFREQNVHFVEGEILPLEQLSSERYHRVYQQYTSTATHLSVNEIGALAIKPPPTERCDVKLIAYYLPQFHPIPENDRWWGKGFTEWRNVAKAVPAFVNHYQPRQPAELGFYDLRVVDVMRRQVELAKLYGIAAFCFHFYWFGGKRLLELPLENYLENKDLDLPFCFCWANENWSRKWDGSDQEMLIGQSHSPEDDIAFIQYLKRYFDDPRYLKIDGKPVLTIYRPALLPDIRGTIARWRREVSDMGFPGIYLVATNSFGFQDYEEAGFDALSEFPPHGLIVDNVSHNLPSLFDHTGWVFPYKDIIENHERQAAKGKVVLPGAMPAWDNSARRPLKGNVFHESTPALFERWLDMNAERAKQNPPGERIVMVNAWNEWAEGAYLEPDRRFGYAYLAACASVVRRHAKRDPHVTELFRQRRAQFHKRNVKAIALHLFYEDLAPRFSEYIRNFEETDIFVTVCDDISFEAAERVVSLFPNAYFQEVENQGRDIKPFLTVMEKIFSYNYEYVCKIHSKQSTHLQDGEIWRDELISMLLSKEASLTLAGLRSNAGMLAVSNSIMTLGDIYVRRHTERKMIELTRRMRIPFSIRNDFIAGSMFWFRPQAMKTLLGLYKDGIEFEPELGQIDGTTAHAIERLFATVARSEGYSVREFGQAVQNPYA